MQLNELKTTFITGMRPKTLVAALIPPIAAQGLVLKEQGIVDWYIIAHCLGLALFIQIATNFYNDAVDFEKGADVKRVGPKRVTNSQNIKHIYLIGHLSLLLAFAFGIPLVLKGGLLIGIIGMISLYFSYGYTGGPYPLAYLGLGELFVFLFFGLVATAGSYYLVASNLTPSALVLAMAIGCLSCALIAINNFRDRKTDKDVGKHTLATKLSDYQFRKVLDLFLYLPYIFLLYFILFLDLKYIAVILAIVLAHRARKIIYDYEKDFELNDALQLAGKHLLVFGLMFTLCSL